MKLFTMAMLATIASAQTGENIHGDVYVDIGLKYGDATKVQIKVWLPKTSWVGLALGATGMATGTDMIQIDGANSAVFDKTSAGYMNPSTDSTDNLTGTFTSIDSSNTSVIIERALDTGDAADYVF